MKKSSKPKHSQLRIIGGTWRSRKITFIDAPELRPTPDRVRETVFNWLASEVIGAHCLDLFAGSGALGFEALSRGAASVHMVDASSEVIQQLQENRVALAAEHLTITQGRIPGVMLSPIQAFDIIFLDPPFHQGLIASTCAWLETQTWVSPHASLYIETERNLKPLPIPAHWQILREKQAGQVAYYWVKR